MKKLFIFLSILTLICFFFFSRSVRSGNWKAIDFATTVKLQERIDNSTHLRTAGFIGNIMEGSTFFASPEVSILIILFITLLTSINIRRRTVHWRGFLIPILFVLLTLGELYGKTVVHHPAPPFFMVKNPITIFPKYYINEQYSYPSGHTARAVFISFSLYSLFTLHNSLKKNLLAKYCFVSCLTLYVLLVSVSRIYLGHHWLSDIIGGILLGFVCSIISIGFAIDGRRTTAYNSHTMSD